MPWVFGEKKHFLGENKEGEVPYYLNYYSGCSHGCLYCYSLCFAQRMGRIKSPQGPRKVNYEDWIKPTLEPQWTGIEQELKSNKWRKEVFLQSTSDSYAPHVDQKVTRKILNWLKAYEYPVLVLTKNPNVLRDKDFFKEYRANCRVGFTITVPEKYEAIRKQVEPNSPSTKERIIALEELYSYGCQTTVSMEPLLPNIDVGDMLDLMDKLRPLIYGVCFIGTLTYSSIPPQFRNLKVWDNIGKKGAYDDYYEELLRQLLPAVRKRYNIATHTFKFCLEHKIKGAEVNYCRLPKEYQKMIADGK
ncbi:DUF5131 family protein [Candidatus Bathyarchaeota archaeon]|nr:DUF5131 family protein [Candidatus Bathyarchaeota archaeon]